MISNSHLSADKAFTTTPAIGLSIDRARIPCRCQGLGLGDVIRAMSRLNGFGDVETWRESLGGAISIRFHDVHCGLGETPVRPTSKNGMMRTTKGFPTWKRDALKPGFVAEIRQVKPATDMSAPSTMSLGIRPVLQVVDLFILLY